jgi:hypothetical protein
MIAEWAGPFCQAWYCWAHAAVVPATVLAVGLLLAAVVAGRDGWPPEPGPHAVRTAAVKTTPRTSLATMTQPPQIDVLAAPYCRAVPADRLHLPASQAFRNDCHRARGRQ